MKFFDKLFGRDTARPSKDKTLRRKDTGNAARDTGAGPGIAAHSKDAASMGKSGQNARASEKKA